MLLNVINWPISCYQGSYIHIDNITWCFQHSHFSLVHSHLSYGNMVWGSAYQFKLKRLVFNFKINVCVIFANYHTMKVHLLHLRNLE